MLSHTKPAWFTSPRPLSSCAMFAATLDSQGENGGMRRESGHFTVILPYKLVDLFRLRQHAKWSPPEREYSVQESTCKYIRCIWNWQDIELGPFGLKIVASWDAKHQIET